MTLFKKLFGMLAVAVSLAFAAQPATASPVGAVHRGGTSWDGQTWHVESGVNGAGQANCASHVTFGSVLTIKVAGGCGGTASSTLNRHQGTWSATFRDTTGGGKYVFLLWPANGSRPEVDFAEDKPTDSARVLTTATYHPKPGCTGCIHSKLGGNFTQWHTASVRWDSSGWTVLMDGKPWAHYAGSYSGQMHVSIHNEPWGSSGSSTLQVSKVSVS